MGGHEEEDREQDCKGPLGQSLGVPWIQGEDRGWNDQILFDQEQARQGCQQEEQVDRCRHQGKEGPEPQGICRDQEGITPLQEGKGTLQLKTCMMALAQGVGISTAFERYQRLDSTKRVEYRR